MRSQPGWASSWTSLMDEVVTFFSCLFMFATIIVF